MNTKSYLFGILTTILIIGIGGGAYYLGTQKQNTDLSPVNLPSVSPTAGITDIDVIEPTDAPEPTSSIPANWQTYTNQKYGFQISYPPAYKALDDANNLYGWPNAVVLIYSGGQSYDLPVEVWDSVAQYEAKYQNTDNLIVHKVGSKYITLVNVNTEPEVDGIIQAFTLLN